MTELVEGRTGVLHSGLSRRTVLKGAAVAGGVLWVAPVIESFPTVAAAGSAVKPQVVTLSGTSTISWMALIVQVGTVYYLAKIYQPDDDGSWVIEWYSGQSSWQDGSAGDGGAQAFPCGDGTTWTIPSPPVLVNTAPSPSPLTLGTVTTDTSGDATSITVTVSSGDSIITEEQHGHNSTTGKGSTCGGSSPLTLTGTITFSVAS